MRKWCIRIIAVLILLAGITIISYPALSNYSYELSQKRLAKQYADTMQARSADETERHLEECNTYNKELLGNETIYTDPFDDKQLDPESMPYAGLLNILGDGVMGSLEYPGVADLLTIYHGTREESLQKGVGHMQGTSLPVGGTGTHCVLVGHSGLSGKKLFTNLDKAKIGDVFYLHILNQTLAYRVDSINVVLPSDTKDLVIDPASDYVTLITCTPYGINTHRLLVRGVRIPYDEAKDHMQQQRSGTWMTQYVKAILAGLVIGITLIVCIKIISRLFGKKRKRNDK